ncbi:DEAD/DEAH box helicase [Apibacter sp. HY039]|uniref:DEAD/DEAH box helicase n=1 Tax=Apibacter sp. HY039 TaxID=2501476 RepID=UPI000FEBE8F4|nr:DEAD/DEAH box helicase [Apibacter sp. HY039]
MSFELLSEPIRKYIRDKRWEELRPIQAAAIARILTTDNNYILASKTASGKTEAAFLPILSTVNFNESGVQVLYISPLIALINDQFLRIEELCKYLEVPVVKWHGEANKSQKNKLLIDPKGIVLITPESLEAMFVNNSYHVRHLFSSLKFMVIDEIHSFIGTDRGIQLMSIISRLNDNSSSPSRIIGLSATIGDFEEAKKFTGRYEETKVLLDKTTNKVQCYFKYFTSDKSELPLDILKDIYLETLNNNVLIFPNSRGKVEEIAVKLKKISERVGKYQNYFSHHSSIDKDVREYIEFFAKNNKRENFTIACTSTLELGIDIGSVDKVIQIDATHSIASLIQRIGRSGRKKDASSKLILYSTNSWSLLQSTATWLLYMDGFLEPPLSVKKPYDILIHQILSIVKEGTGININNLIKKIEKNSAFINISVEEIKELISYSIENEIIEKIGSEIIMGIEGEKIVNNRNFYSVFKTENNFKVINSGNTIGELPFSPQIQVEENIFLAARVWKIKTIDFKSHRIEVCPAADGKKPKFFGTSGEVHSKIRKKMLEILTSDENYEFLDIASYEELELLRKKFKIFNLNPNTEDRPVSIVGTQLTWYTFAGSRINRTLELLFEIAGIPYSMDEQESTFQLQTTDLKWNNLTHILFNSMENIDQQLLCFLEKYPSIIEFSKWSFLLPKKYQIYILKQKYYDFESTANYLKSIKLVVSHNQSY